MLIFFDWIVWAFSLIKIVKCEYYILSNKIFIK